MWLGKTVGEEVAGIGHCHCGGTRREVVGD